MSLFARRVEGLRPGTYRLTGNGKRQYPGSLSDPVVSRLCMEQRHSGDAAAHVLLHASRRELVAAKRPMRELLFRAGATGHLIYLGAAAAGLGITGIGQFDSRQWVRAARLPDEQELLYVLALGHNDNGALP